MRKVLLLAALTMAASLVFVPLALLMGRGLLALRIVRRG